MDMSVKMYQECMIIPFFYEADEFAVIQDKNSIGEFFERVEVKTEAYNKEGRNLLTEEGRKSNLQLMQRYRLNDKGRKYCNLHHNKPHFYEVKCGGKRYSTQVGDVEAWLFKGGRGFLTIQLKSPLKKSPQEKFPLETEEKALEFHALRWSSSKTVFIWEKRKSKDEAEMIEFTLEQLKGKCFELLKFVPEGKDTYNLAFILTDNGQESISEENLKSFCLQQRIGRSNFDVGDSIQIYKYCDYIHWAISANTVAVWSDTGIAGEENETFLKSNFPDSVFNNYLILYMYYLTRKHKCSQLEQIVAKSIQDGSDKISQEERMQFFHIETRLPPLAEGKYGQLDVVFREILCKKIWNLSERLKQLAEKEGPRIWHDAKCDVFISYRHDGGQYLALLIYNYFKKNGKTVVWDYWSIKAGEFAEQIYDFIKECEAVIVILSPGSYERMKDEGDWGRKEILCAMEAKKKVLLVLMENVKRLDENEVKATLPEELHGISKFHAIGVGAATFDSDIKRVWNALQ